jgi:hypothetical protein
MPKSAVWTGGCFHRVVFLEIAEGIKLMAERSVALHGLKIFLEVEREKSTCRYGLVLSVVKTIVGAVKGNHAIVCNNAKQLDE